MALARAEAEYAMAKRDFLRQQAGGEALVANVAAKQTEIASAEAELATADAAWRNLCTVGLVFKLVHGLLKQRRNVDGIFHMARAFGGDEVTHVEGSVDPVRDLDIIHNELLQKDLATVGTKVEAMRKQVEERTGGDGGGEIVVAGTPEDVAREKRSYTGHFLKDVLRRGKKQAAE